MFSICLNGMGEWFTFFTMPVSVSAAQVRLGGLGNPGKHRGRGEKEGGGGGKRVCFEGAACVF